MKAFRFFILFFALFALSTPASSQGFEKNLAEFSDSLMSVNVGVDLFEEEIDAVLFQTNEFLTDSTFLGVNGPFWLILQMSICLAALFALIMAAGMAYKMMVKGEGIDILKILRAFAIATVLMFWYGNPTGKTGIESAIQSSDGYVNDGGVLDMIAYIPNCLGSYTHDLYESEALNVEQKLKELTPLLKKRDQMAREKSSSANAVSKNTVALSAQIAKDDLISTEQKTETDVKTEEQREQTTFAGIMVALDKILIFMSLVMFRIGWWGTIFVQQILLGALTIFGPIQFAFSLLPKFEGAWAKWLGRYLTTHLYGCMLFFVGFYVLLLFDIVISIQIDQLTQITSSPEKFTSYVRSVFLTAGYLLAAGAVSMRCLGLVPDLAAWLVPEGETSFAARGFGEGVAQSVKSETSSLTSGILRH